MLENGNIGMMEEWNFRKISIRKFFGNLLKKYSIMILSFLLPIIPLFQHSK
jgi:hypothetical protein